MASEPDVQAHGDESPNGLRERVRALEREISYLRTHGTEGMSGLKEKIANIERQLEKLFISVSTLDKEYDRRVGNNYKLLWAIVMVLLAAALSVVVASLKSGGAPG